MKIKLNGTTLIDERTIYILSDVIADYIKHLKEVSEIQSYAYDESSINLPFDEDAFKHVASVKKKMTSSKLKYVIDVGIGGSNLGTKAIYDAVRGFFDGVTPDEFPKMYFADTTDPHQLHKFQKFIKGTKDTDELLLNVVSKSGRTTETIANLQILLGTSSRLKDRLVITTDFESDLWNEAQKNGIQCLPIPKKVGGRYSVFSAVGLFPLLCAKIDIADLLAGAMKMRKKCLSINVAENPAALSAIILYAHYKKRRKINDNFFFHPELESVGKWYRQLMGESIGKDGLGLTPTVSIGSTDLHSMGQLYLGGPKDKIFTFISAKEHCDKVNVPAEGLFAEFSPSFHNKSADEIMDAILEGVKTIYKYEKIPYMSVVLDDVSEFSLGEFMQFKMIEMMYLGKLLGVNAFNQPDVEAYKSETRRILEKK